MVIDLQFDLVLTPNYGLPLCVNPVLAWSSPEKDTNSVESGLHACTHFGCGPHQARISLYRITSSLPVVLQPLYAAIQIQVIVVQQP
jgi:hypothetical protein